MVINNILKIKNLTAEISGKKILRGINLDVKPGQVTVLMGPNGSGKSTLAQSLLGIGGYKVSGQVQWRGRNILKLKPWERARLGLFLSWQYPQELPGVNMYEFLSAAYKQLQGEKKFLSNFEKEVNYALTKLRLSSGFLQRDVNAGFSGGEKKKSEILQLMLLNPNLAILDETDSGLDIDALKLVAVSVKELKRKGVGFLIITHYQRLLNLLQPNTVFVMLDGKIVKKGGKKLVKDLEKRGYDWLRK